jgi:hypothetical protein
LAEHRIGTFEVVAHGGRTQLGLPKQRAFPAILWLDADQIVSSDRLIDLGSGDRARRSGVRSIQICGSELRIHSEFPILGLCDISGTDEGVDGHVDAGTWHRARLGGCGCG